MFSHVFCAFSCVLLSSELRALFRYCRTQEELRAVLEKEGISLSTYEDALKFSVREESSVESIGLDTGDHQEANLSSTFSRQVDSIENSGDRTSNPPMEAGVR